MIVALASPRVATSLEEGLEKMRRLLSEASARGAEIVCFPEAYLPGLRGQDFDVLPFGPAEQERALARRGAVGARIRRGDDPRNGEAHGHGPADRRLRRRRTRARSSGYQTKNQLDPDRRPLLRARETPGGSSRSTASKFGVAICHEGWRYPETVRWAAMRGAKIVFHPQHTGSDRERRAPTSGARPAAPYYEKAMMCRSLENTIYFASVNYALRFQESATSLIAPSGECQAYLPYGEEGVLVEAIHVEEATGLLAARYAPERYRETGEGLTREPA